LLQLFFGIALTDAVVSVDLIPYSRFTLESWESLD